MPFPDAGFSIVVEPLHVAPGPAECSSPGLQIVIVGLVASVLACPEPLPMKLKDLGWSYPDRPRTLDSFFIALSPFYFVDIARW